LFDPICERFCIPLQNIKGWADINGPAGMMKRFSKWERRGKRCILLLCGDHDPGGLLISTNMRSNLVLALCLILIYAALSAPLPYRRSNKRFCR
jgi:hypothetical protein